MGALPLSLMKSLDVDKLTDIVKSIHHGAMAALATVLSTYAANISIAADVSDTLYKVCITILQPRIDILTEKAEKTTAGSGKALEGHITGFLKGAIMSGALTFTVNHPKLMRSFWSSIVGADMFLSSACTCNLRATPGTSLERQNRSASPLLTSEWSDRTSGLTASLFERCRSIFRPRLN